MKRLLTALVVALACLAAVAAARMPQEPSASVPAFDRFHEVIAPMWHTAYPARDVVALRRASKDVDAGVAAIAAAELPGILHEKEAAWSKGLVELKAASAAYASAAAGTDDRALLAAAERLHTAYEAQGQIIRPPVPAMNDFHVVLYVVQHTDLPEKNWAAVCQAAPKLHEKAGAIAGSTLPKRLEGKTAAFKTESTGLVADAAALVAACKVNEPSGIEKAAATLHARYEGLTKIFE